MKFLSVSLIALTIFCNILEAKSFRSSSRSSVRSSSFKSSTSTRSSSTIKISTPKATTPVKTIKAIRPSTPKLNTTNRSTIINNTTVVNENRGSGSSDFVNGMLIGNMINRPASTVVVSNPVMRSEEEVVVKNIVKTEKKESFIFRTLSTVVKIIGVAIIAIVLLALIF